MEKVGWCIDEKEGFAGAGTCGCLCVGYKPRNKKSGICKFFRMLRLDREELTRLVQIGYSAFKEEAARKIRDIKDELRNGKIR